MDLSITVGSGRSPPLADTSTSSLGTTLIISTDTTTAPTQTMINGYISAESTLFFWRDCLSMNDDTRSSTTSVLPAASPARTMLTNSLLNTTGCCSMPSAKLAPWVMRSRTLRNTASSEGVSIWSTRARRASLSGMPEPSSVASWRVIWGSSFLVWAPRRRALSQPNSERPFLVEMSSTSAMSVTIRPSRRSLRRASRTVSASAMPDFT